MKKEYKDFKCDCACGQRLRVLWMFSQNGKMVDIGIMKRGERRPRLGVVLRDHELEEFIGI